VGATCLLKSEAIDLQTASALWVQPVCSRVKREKRILGASQEVVDISKHERYHTTFTVPVRNGYKSQCPVGAILTESVRFKS